MMKLQDCNGSVRDCRCSDAVSADGDNVSKMLRLIDITIARFPWVQMVVFSELACCGPLPNNPVTLPGPGGKCVAGGRAISTAYG